jgi:hypothetical protein
MKPSMTGVQIESADSPGGFVGLPESLISNIHLNNVHVKETKGKWHCEDIDKATSSATVGLFMRRDYRNA